MNFAVYGPFPIIRNGRNVARDAKTKRAFWEVVDEEDDGLSDACGCYVFVIRNRAWYVGKAEKQSFSRECFALHKIVQYNDALQEVQGRPSLLLIAKITRGNRFARPSARGHKDIDLLENLLIGAALRRNPRLQNIKRTKHLRQMHVPGVLNTRKGEGRSIAVQALRGTLDV